MLPTINGKSFLNCTIEDIKNILDDQDYRESEYLDYKKSFEIIEIPKSSIESLNRAKAEFRKDVCAFANAQGGYIIYGVKEDGKAVPHELFGIEIDNNNTEAFENTVKNALQTISPRIPHFEINFIKKSNNYIVVLFIQHDYFAPYVFLENNQDYRVYRRVGSSVKVLTYLEMKTMFTQSINFEREIEQFRRERISFFQNSTGKFALFHIIPDTFLDSGYNQPVFILERKGARLSSMFSYYLGDFHSQPIIEGFRCSSRRFGRECRLYNNGIAECFVPLLPYYIDTAEQRNAENDFFRENNVWEIVEKTLIEYASRAKTVFEYQRLYICFSVLGCKDNVTAVDDFHHITGSIDRDMLICTPIVFEKSEDETENELNIKRFRLEYLLSLGIQSTTLIDSLIKEVYN